MSNSISKESETKTISIEGHIELNEITPKFYRILVQMSPFGDGNPEPVFKTVKCLDSGGTKIVGKLNDHLKLELIDALGNRFKGIGFKMAEHYEKIKNQVHWYARLSHK